MTNDERLQPTELLPEMATLDCGTLNFGGDEIFENTENTIKYFGQKMIEAGHQTRAGGLRQKYDRNGAPPAQEGGYIAAPISTS